MFLVGVSIIARPLLVRFSVFSWNNQLWNYDRNRLKMNLKRTIFKFDKLGALFHFLLCYILWTNIANNGKEHRAYQIWRLFSSSSFSINFYRNFKVDYFNKELKVSLRDVLRSFTHRRETFSEIEAIAKKAESPINIANVLENCFNEISKVTETKDINFKQKTHLNFLSWKLLLQRF